MDIEQLLQQMGMSGGYQASNPQGPSLGQGPAPDPFGGMASGQEDIKPGSGDIVGNLITGQKIETVKDLTDQYLNRYTPTTKKGKANEYLKAILAGFTHNEYMSPARKAEMMAQKDFKLNTERRNSEAKDIKNLIDQQRYQGMLQQAAAKIEETRQERLRKTTADQNKDAVARALVDLKKADSEGATAKSAAQIRLNQAAAAMKEAYTKNPEFYKEAGITGIAKRAVELSGVDPDTTAGKKLLDQFWLAAESEKLFGDKTYTRESESTGPHPIAAVGPDNRLQVAFPNITRKNVTTGGRSESPLNKLFQGIASQGQTQPSLNMMGQPITPQSTPPPTMAPQAVPEQEAPPPRPLAKPQIPPPNLTPTADARPAQKLVAQPSSITNVNGVPVLHLNAYKDGTNAQFQIKLIDTMDNIVSGLSQSIADGTADKFLGFRGGKVRHEISRVVNGGLGNWSKYYPELQNLITNTDISTLAKTYADSGKQINSQELEIAKKYWPHVGALTADSPQVALQTALMINIILRAGAWKTQIASQLNLTPEEVNKIKTDNKAMEVSKELTKKVMDKTITSEELTRALDPSVLFADEFAKNFSQRPSPFTPKKNKGSVRVL